MLTLQEVIRWLADAARARTGCTAFQAGGRRCRRSSTSLATRIPSTCRRAPSRSPPTSCRFRSANRRRGALAPMSSNGRSRSRGTLADGPLRPASEDTAPTHVASVAPVRALPPTTTGASTRRAAAAHGARGLPKKAAPRACRKKGGPPRFRKKGDPPRRGEEGRPGRCRRPRERNTLRTPSPTRAVIAPTRPASTSARRWMAGSRPSEYRQPWSRRWCAGWPRSTSDCGLATPPIRRATASWCSRR